MTRILRFALPLYLVVLFQGNQLHAAAAHWTQPGSLAEPRSGSAAAVLSDGRVLITGGAGSGGPLATTEVFNADGSFSASAPMLDARANHTAVVLQDGRVLVAGGMTTGGAITNTAEIYDPSLNTWTLVAGGMSLQRSGHSASLLSDGRVLVAGGQSPSGPTNTLEIFSPATNTFTLITSGTLTSARAQHAAAVLADGRVLIAGGSDGTNALKSTDIFDPSSGNVSPSASMSMPRVGLSATALLDGTVLIAGGNDGNADLASAEIYDPIAATFSATGNLTVARSGHLAFSLPNNNEVLVAGGISSGTPLAVAELFVPWTKSFNSTGAMAVARTATAGSPLKQKGQLLVAGGSDGKNSLASSELYSFATVMTDKTDYPPGTTVNISGSGWQPGETVTLTLVESPLYDTHGPYTAVADSNGNIFNNQFMTDEHDANIRFYLTAKGSASQAQITFTDGSVQTISGTVTNSATGDPISGATVSCSSGCNNNFSTTTDGQGKYSLVQVTFSGNSATLTLGAAAAGYKTMDIPVSVSNSINNYSGNDFKLAPTSTATALSVAPSTGMYGGTATVAATLTSGGSPVSGKSITFTLNGTSVGSATTEANGVAQLANVSLSGINAGIYTAGVAASFVGDASSGASSNAANLTVNKATANVSVTGYSTTYDGTAHTAAGTATGVKGEALSGLNLSGTTHINAGTYSDKWTFTDATGNYNSTSGTVSDSIAKATPTVSVTGGTYTYDANPHSATAKISGVSGDNSLTASMVTLTYVPGGAAAPVNAGSYSVTGSFAGNENYNPATSNSAAVTINKADAKITIAPYNLTYDGAAHTATGTAAGVKGEALSGLDLSETTHTDAGTYASDSWTFTDSTGNYNNTSGTVSDSIAKASPTVIVTGGTYVYDAKAHPASATVTGIAGDSSLAAAVVTFSYTPGGAAAPVNAATYAVSGTFGGSRNYNPASGTATITINKATPTLTVSGGTYTYDGNPHPGSASITGAPGDSMLASMVTLSYMPGGTVVPVNAGSYSAMGSFPGTENYNAVTSTPANITINPADAKITVYGYTGTYDGNAHRATGSAMGVKGEDLSSLLNLGGSFIDVPGGTATWTFSGNINYKPASGTALVIINAAPTLTSLASSLSQSSGAVTVTLTATVGSSVPPVGGIVTFTDTLNNNAVFGTAGLVSGTASITIQAGSLSAGPHAISAAYAPPSLDFSGSASTPNPAPGVTITNPCSGYVSALASPVSFSATFSGIATSATPSAEWTFTNTGTNASTNGIGTISGGNITGSNTFASAGVFGVTLTFTDGLGDIVTVNTVNSPGAPAGLPANVVIYDPSAGFVTGGGWIDSPLSAYAADPSLTGKATFGFVSKYQKGATVPTGDTQFTFQVGKLDFHSTSYEWLVISGPMAQYKGSGTINGAGNYNFLLTARDGNQAGKNTPDGFRIKITDASTGDVIYDNIPGNSDSVSSGNTQALGGGSIIIHSN